LSVFTHILTYVGTPALVLAFGTSAWRICRAMLLYRAGSAALNQGSDDERRKAGLKIIKVLTSDDEPWYRAILPWRRSGDGQQ